jgi:hypothetical protein
MRNDKMPAWGGAAVICTAACLASCSDDGKKSGNGSLNVGGTVSVASVNCPQIGSIVVVPDQAPVGSSVALIGAANTVDGGNPTLLWSAPSGSFGDVYAANTRFRCDVAGRVTLTLRATADGCDISVSVPVDCLSPDGAAL